MKIGINGFGRIGRLALRLILEDDELDVVAINDLCDAESLAYLLKYDTNHRGFHTDEISFDQNNIIYNGKKIRVLSHKDPESIPWDVLGVEVVLECSGLFTSLDSAKKHIKAGAKKVVISAPAKGDVKTIVYNVNDDILNGSEQVISAASCTTNCLAPVLKVINDNYTIKKGFMTTVHAYTNDQATLDVAHKKGILSRRGRAAAANIVPSTTGAALAIGKVIPSLDGKLDGNAYRVPVSDGSLIDVVLELSENTSVEEINNLFMNNQNETLKFTMDPIVSSDVLGMHYGSLVDGLLTNVLTTDGKQLVKIVAWYDNEMSYTAQMIRTTKSLINKSNGVN